jgi:DNA-binding CsgD family transcriptional regulator
VRKQTIKTRFVIENWECSLVKSSLFIFTIYRHNARQQQKIVMNKWQEDLLSMVGHAQSEREIFSCIKSASMTLGFEKVSYGLRTPLPLSDPRTLLFNNYPQAWSSRYIEADYIKTDPTVLHGLKTQLPIIWSDAVFSNAKSLWEEAQSFGLKVGWAQSSLDNGGAGGMLSLSRSCTPLSVKELNMNQSKMCWLVHISHMALSQALKKKSIAESPHRLTSREVEILKWTGDGKSSQDIADILILSRNTVEYHVKNAVNKLGATNKTAAVVRAALLGFLC